MSSLIHDLIEKLIRILIAEISSLFQCVRIQSLLLQVFILNVVLESDIST